MRSSRGGVRAPGPTPSAAPAPAARRGTSACRSTRCRRPTRRSSRSIPPSDVTQSASSSASPLFAPSVARSLRMPVEVSACTTAIIFGAGCASSSVCGSIGVPHGASTRTTSAPHRAATSHMRPPNTPLTPITTVSPGPTKLTNAASMPGGPGARDGERQLILRLEAVSQAITDLVHQRDEVRVEVAEHRPRHTPR